MWFLSHHHCTNFRLHYPIPPQSLATTLSAAILAPARRKSGSWGPMSRCHNPRRERGTGGERNLTRTRDALITPAPPPFGRSSHQIENRPRSIMNAVCLGCQRMPFLPFGFPTAPRGRARTPSFFVPFWFPLAHLFVQDGWMMTRRLFSSPLPLHPRLTRHTILTGWLAGWLASSFRIQNPHASHKRLTRWIIRWWDGVSFADSSRPFDMRLPICWGAMQNSRPSSGLHSV